MKDGRGQTKNIYGEEELGRMYVMGGRSYETRVHMNHNMTVELDTNTCAKCHHTVIKYDIFGGCQIQGTKE